MPGPNVTEFIPFARPCIDAEEIAEVVDSLKAGWVTTGPKARRFEEDFARYIGGGVETVALNSATAGLHLALEALGISAGDEVITTPYTFTATAEVVRYLGADPVFVDIDPDTLNIDAACIEAALTEKTRAIIPVHFAGLSCNMDEILAVAGKHGLKVVEDAAHALPCRYRQQLIGSLDSDATVFSFYANKTITTGEGGMLVTRNHALAERCRTMRLHGINRDVFARYSSDQPSWFYEVVAPGFKYNMTDIAAAIGIHQLQKANRFQQQREQLANVYLGELADLPLRMPATAPPGWQHAWHLFVVRIHGDAPVGRNEFIEKMAEQKIGCSVHFIPLHVQPYWRDRYHFRPEDFPNAWQAYAGAVSLPLYPRMTEAEQLRVMDAVRSILQ
jgi:dTDP-4-amino-4,6-dideoxygalactose transaminase